MYKNEKFYPFLGVFLGILIGAILIFLSGNGFFTIFSSIANGTVLDLYNAGEWLMRSSILILTGLSVAFAARTGIFNIGAEGQFIVSTMCATLVGVYADLPPGIHVVVAISVGILAGALYAMIPGLLKAYYGVNEVVVTIMLNWIALYYTNYLISNPFAGATTSQTHPIQSTASLGSDFLSTVFQGAKMHYGFIFVLLSLFIYWFILEKTTYGYELKAVGFNSKASKYAGIKEKRTIVSTLMISGAFAGLAGAIYALGAVDALTTTAAFRNYGFDGITVAYLGQMNAIGVTLAALLIGGLRNAGNLMTQTPKEIIDIVIAIIFMFSVLIPLVLKSKKENK